MEKFKALGLSDNMLKALSKKGFEEPSPIQEKVIPYLLDNAKDVMAQAQTGTGKTAAFGIPIIEQIDARAKHTKALVLAPTRELAIQVAEEINSFKGTKKLNILPVYGGQDMGLQLKHLRRGADIVVGTPGRTLDHLKRGTLNIESINFLVLDEADEMLNMGFKEEIEAILEFAPAERQTLLFSATMPKTIIGIAKRYMREYDTISVKSEQVTTSLTDQIYFEVHEQDKFEALCRIIDMEPEFYGLVFCRTRVDTSEIAAKLEARGYDADALHGEITQSQRLRILQRFRDGKINIMTATDVAARGIDISNLTHVINYTLPQDPESYVHRIGRTGRAGNEGTAITFVTPKEYRGLSFIKRSSGANIRKGQIPKVDEVIAAKKIKIKSVIETVLNEEELQPYDSLALEMLNNGVHPVDLVAACLRFTFENELDSSHYHDIRQVTAPSIDRKGRTRLFVAKGRKHNIQNPAQMARFIRQQTGIQEQQVRDIQIFDQFTFVSVPFSDAEDILRKFRNQKGRPLITKAKPDNRDFKKREYKGKKK